MDWLVSGFSTVVLHADSLEPSPPHRHGLKAGPPVCRNQICFRFHSSSFQVLRSWRAAVSPAVDNYFKYLVPSTKPSTSWCPCGLHCAWWTAALQGPVDRGARVACSRWVPARSHGRFSPTLLAWKLAQTGGGQLKKFFFAHQPAGGDARCRGGIIA